MHELVEIAILSKQIWNFCNKIGQRIILPMCLHLQDFPLTINGFALILLYLRYFRFFWGEVKQEITRLIKLKTFITISNVFIHNIISYKHV